MLPAGMQGHQKYSSVHWGSMDGTGLGLGRERKLQPSLGGRQGRVLFRRNVQPHGVLRREDDHGEELERLQLPLMLAVERLRRPGLAPAHSDPPQL